MSNMVVNTNIAAIDSHRNMKKVGTQQFQAATRLSSGLRVNSAADDAAGLAISEKMRSQIRGLDMASKNSQDGISLIQTAEGGMQEIDNMIQRMRELIVYAANDTNDNGTTSASNAGSTEYKNAVASGLYGDRMKIEDELAQLAMEIDSMASRVEFNKKRLIDGTYASGASGPGGSGLWFQTGANATQGILVNIGSVMTSALGIGKGTSALSLADIGKGTLGSAGGKGIRTMTGSAITKLLSAYDIALSKVTTERAKLGAIQNRLEYTIKSLDLSSENLAASESRIRDADMGKEMMNLTKANVLQQAATSMLAQNNQNPQMVLQLLR